MKRVFARPAVSSANLRHACYAVLILAATMAVARAAETAPVDLLHEVDPFVGVDGGGNTVPGAQVPFGFASPSPDTASVVSSGYATDAPIIGFSQTHVSGTGGDSKYGNFRIMPQVGPVRLQERGSGKAGERAAPGYYSVRLTGPEVQVELTATRMVAVHRYTFPVTPEAQLLLDVSAVIVTDGGTKQRPLACEARVVAPNRIEGTGRFTGGWNPSPYTLHFVAEFNRNFRAHGAWRADRLEPGASAVSAPDGPCGVYATFDARTEPAVEVKVAVSFVSVERARQHLADEAAGAGFDTILQRAGRQWHDALGRIAVEGGTPEQRRIFASALYRSQVMPHDLSGDNAWWASEEPHYEDFYCLWDTFRCLHPLLTLIQPERQQGMVRSLIDTYRHTGWLPDARVAGANGLTQGGSNADVVIADAVVKGLPGLDLVTAYAALQKDAEVESPRPVMEGRELSEYVRLGYLSLNQERSVSRTLEYCYDDFCIGLVALKLGRAADVRRYFQRSRQWTKLWDPGTRTVRPKYADGRWMEPYSTTEIYSLSSPRFTWWGAPYYEGSGYQYSTYVPHQPDELMRRVGGPAAFVDWLDVFFGAKPAPQPVAKDGLYSQANEPDILAPYLYLYAGRPDRTQEAVRRILATEYRATRDGLPGNDDAGTMSSWYVWNAIGLYPNAGQPLYYIGSPTLTRARIDLGGGRSFTIEAPESSAGNQYVQGASLNGRELNRAWLRHEEIAAGGTLVLRMGPRPSRWGSTEPPPSGLSESD
jgi:predicted alpha-1,2-mannosidase